MPTPNLQKNTVELAPPSQWKAMPNDYTPDKSLDFTLPSFPITPEDAELIRRMSELGSTVGKPTLRAGPAAPVKTS